MALQPYIPEVITSDWLPIRELQRLLDGNGVVIESGFVQDRTVKLWWIGEKEVMNLRIILEKPEFFPVTQGWVYDLPGTPNPIIDTVKIYNITIQGKRYSATPR